MNLKTLLDKKGMTMYRLSKLSGVPKTTVIDICSGKSSIGGCKAKTVLKLSQTLGCTMEELMQIDNANYDKNTGKPKDNSYFERGLPKYLSDSLNAMIKSWEIEDSGESDLHFYIYWSELNADINRAETEHEISSEQAWYLRRKYLRIKE